MGGRAIRDGRRRNSDRGSQRHRCGFRAPARCRCEHRRSWPSPRFFAVRGYAVPGPARHPVLRGTRRERSHPDGWGWRRRGPAGRCADRRSAFPCLRPVRANGGTRFRPPLGGRCRSETGAPARAPRGSGVRGSRACAPPCPPGYAPRKEPSRRLGSTPPRPCGPLCRPPPGELARGRRSLACVP